MRINRRELTAQQAKERKELLAMGNSFLRFIEEPKEKKTKSEGIEFAKIQKQKIKQRKWLK